jgi:cysteine desulfurase
MARVKLWMTTPSIKEQSGINRHQRYTFPVIYFDHNATSPLSPTAKDAWISAIERYPANPSSPHRLGSRAEVALSAARQSAAAHLGCSEFDLVWTSGATEGNNAIFFHASRTSNQDAWISAIEHPSVIAAANRWFPNKVQLLKVTPEGAVDLNFLSDRLKQSRPAIIAIMAANNETGVHQPWTEALRLCREREIPLACDAAQWIGKEPSAGLGLCDFVTACAHKFGGPLGIGILKVPRNFEPLLVGGPQEEGRRAGTENLPSALAMVASWSEREQRISSGEIETRLRWRDDFTKNLQQALPEIEILGVNKNRLWNTVATLMPQTPDCRRRWVVQLDKLGFAVSTGSACASGKEKPSHVLTAMGCDSTKADRMLRFSSGWDTTENDWRQLLEAIKTAHIEFGLQTIPKKSSK